MLLDDAVHATCLRCLQGYGGSGFWRQDDLQPVGPLVQIDAAGAVTSQPGTLVGREMILLAVVAQQTAAGQKMVAGRGQISDGQHEAGGSREGVGRRT